MSLLEIFFLALALSMDAFSVAVVLCMKERCNKKQVFYVSSAFAFFQFLMPLIGWYIFAKLQVFLSEYTAWIAFILLSMVGCKMLWEGIQGFCKGPCKTCCHAHTLKENSSLNFLTLLSLSIATSIDALAVGASLESLGVSIWLPAIIIGVVCFVVTAFGMLCSGYILRKKSCISCYANVLGGAVLTGIGVKLLLS